MFNKLFFLLPFFLPAYHIKISLPVGGSLNLLDMLILICILIYVFGIFTKQKKEFVEFALKNKTPLVLLALLVLGLLLSFMFNANRDNWTGSLGIVKSFYLLPIVFAFFASFYVSQKLVDIKYFFAGYFFYGSLLAIIGLACLLSGKLTYDGRLSLFFESPNHLAMTLAPALIIGFYYSSLFVHGQYDNNTINKLKTAKKPNLIAPWAVSLTLIQLFALLFTRSLGVFIGLSAAAGYLFFPQLRKIVFAATLAFAIIFVFFVFNSSFLLKTTNYHPNTPPDAVDSRLAIYQADEKIIKQNLIFGIGSNNFQQVYLDYQQYFPPYPQWAVPHAHNLLANIWLETGIIGLFSFLGIIYFVYKKIPAKGSHVRTYVMTSVSILIYFLIHGLFDATYWKNDLAIMFWLVVALPLFAEKNKLVL